MNKHSVADTNIGNNGEVNRVADYTEPEQLNATDQPKVEMPKPEKSQTKSGGWFAKPPVRKDYIPPAPTSYPMKVPKDFHQTWAIDTANGEGVVYTIEVTHPDGNEAKTYIVHPEVVREAIRRCSGGDYTFSILTDKNDGIGGEIRSVELHPWGEQNRTIRVDAS
jgi:hypothetical protein